MDGKLDPDELVKAFKELGIEIDRAEGIKLVQRYLCAYNSFN